MSEEDNVEENNQQNGGEYGDESSQGIERMEDYNLPHNYLFRICLLGDAGVGKTSLITRFCDNSFNINYNNTIGLDFRVVTLKYKDIISKVHIWDTAGQERFRFLALNYLHNSHGFVFVYDITDKNSFNNIENWITTALDKNKKSIANFLIGNKCDKEGERQVSREEAERFAKEKNLFFLETSAKNNDNVQQIFYYFTLKLLEYYNNNEYVEEENMVLSSTKCEEIPIIRPGENKCNC
jgi:Ras-related protein Rab-1A